MCPWWKKCPRWDTTTQESRYVCWPTRTRAIFNVRPSRHPSGICDNNDAGRMTWAEKCARFRQTSGHPLLWNEIQQTNTCMQKKKQQTNKTNRKKNWNAKVVRVASMFVLCRFAWNPAEPERRGAAAANEAAPAEPAGSCRLVTAGDAGVFWVKNRGSHLRGSVHNKSITGKRSSEFLS